MSASGRLIPATDPQRLLRRYFCRPERRVLDRGARLDRAGQEQHERASLLACGPQQRIDVVHLAGKRSPRLGKQHISQGQRVGLFRSLAAASCVQPC
jgi:hypothetical protein